MILYVTILPQCILFCGQFGENPRLYKESAGQQRDKKETEKENFLIPDITWNEAE